VFESLQRAWKGDDPTMSVLRASFAVASASAAALAPVHLGAGPARPVAAPVRRGNAPAGFQPILAIKNNGLGFQGIDRFVRQHGGAGVLDGVRRLMRGNEPGVVAYLPNSGSLFFSASTPTVKINGSPLRPTVVANPKTGDISAGVGNFYAAPGPKGHLWFWNALANTTAIRNGITRSAAAPGQEVSLGSASLGIAVLPQCRQGSAQPGLVTTVGYGTSLRMGLVARDGQLQFKLGNLRLEPVLAQAAMSATAEILSRTDALLCRSGSVAQQAAEVARGVVRRLSSSMQHGAPAQHATAVAGFAAALASAMLGGLTPQGAW
jgi:hypothetical protein